ncbi:glycosyltransferase family 4 protein [Campylobacter sp. MG1]|uniref:glycosyltransferase family 4 protein n=1 Tax=Campylobacter sp. MG1 TaxID=2976332 RepID=UPI00226D0F99|nr:glycosyltransferase family 4 protein [Campylobacter sp. MG1]
MPRHYIHFHQGYDINKGGTIGYNSILLDSFRCYNKNFKTNNGIECAFIYPNIKPTERLNNELLRDIIDLRFQYTQEYKNEKINNNLIKIRKNWFKEILPLELYSKINTHEISSIHIHGAYNFLPIYNSLAKMGVDSKVLKILTTHNPFKPEVEDLELSNQNNTLNQNMIDMLSFFFKERDYWAFRLADTLIFPSEYSIEGYYETWPEFKDIIKNKKIFFTTTGTKEKKSNTTKKIKRKELNIPNNAKVFLYLGRFIKIRGYDLLIEAAKHILKKEDNIYFVVVGENREKVMNHKNWIQIPFTDSPGDFINMADACLCPNRGSLFDLSMIEILSLAKPIICAKVGGYKFLENKTSGVIYFEKENIFDFINAIEKFLTLNQINIDKMGQENRKLYDTELNLENFQRNYCNTIDEIYDYFKISSNNYSFADKTHLFPLEKEVKNIPIIKKEQKTPIIDSVVQKVNNVIPVENQKIKNRKIRKLVYSPNLFFRDMLINIKNNKKLKKLKHNPKRFFKDFAINLINKIFR